MGHALSTPEPQPLSESNSQALFPDYSQSAISVFQKHQDSASFWTLFNFFKVLD